MKTKLTNTALLLSLTAVLACSKFESNDMKFKRAISEQGISAPSPGESSNPSPDPSVVEVPAPKPEVIVSVPTPSADSGSTAVDTKTTDTKTTDTKTTDTTATTDTKNTDTKTTDTTATTDTKTTDTKTTDTTVSTDTKTTDTKTTDTKTTDTKTESDIMYADSDIPTCKLNLTYNGAGSAARISVASATSDDLKNLSYEGFDSLSADELKAMKNAVDKMVSGGGVQVVKSGEKFAKDKGTARALIVTDGKEAVDLNLNGLGKGAQVFLMNVSEKHNTVCLQVNGVTDSSKVFVSAQGDPMYVSRAKIDFNGSGAAETHVKVIGGNQTGSDINVNGFSDSDLYLVTEGKNDTFSAISANNVSKSHLDLKIKGKNDTGLGVTAKDIDHSKIHLEMEGADNVKALMAVKKMYDNDIDGFMNYHTGKVDPALADYIKVATYP
jgi:hypothetical protein